MKNGGRGPARIPPLPLRAYAAAFALTFLALSCRSSAGAEEIPWRVLILHAYNYTLPALTLATDGARTRLFERSPRKIELDAVYLDLARYAEPEQEMLMAKFLRDRYASRQPDVVIAAGADALPFITRHRDGFAPGVPVVFLGVSITSYQALRPPPDVTGHVIDLDLILDRTLGLAERLQPDAHRLFFVAGSATVDRRWQLIARRIAERRQRRFDVTYLFDLSYDALMAEISRVPRDSVVVFLSFLRDGAGNALPPGEVATTLSKLSPAPVYSPYEHPLKGPVGGYVETFASMGSTAADIVLEVLGGKDPATIPPRPNPDIGYRVDDKALQRWGLSERNLPPGTIVTDREPGLWELYRGYVIVALSLIALQAVLIAALLMQARRRRAAEASILAKESALRVSYEQVRELNTRLVNAQEEERARIARELHDDVGQRVASLSIGLSGLKRRPAVTDEAVRDELSELQHKAVDLAKGLRDLSHQLHPGVLQHVGLAEALRTRCEEISVRSNINLELEVANDWSEVTDEVALCLYRVAQEALQNIVKHSNATSGRISLARHDGRVVMRVADEGRGLAAGPSNGHQGIGLISMRERVQMLGGSFEMRSSANAGTVAVVSIPTGEQR